MLREIWRAGGLDAREELQFAGPYLVLSFAPDGNAYVLDQTLSAITVLDAGTGHFVDRFGRPGRGPGELGAAAAMAWDGLGRLWVAASFDRRYSVFDPAGGLLKTVSRPASTTSRRVFPLAVLSDGTVLDHGSGYPRIRFQHLDSLGEPVDTFSVPLPPVGPLAGILRPGSALVEASAFRPGLRWTFARDGRSIWTSRSDSLTLVQLSLRGDTLRAVQHLHRRGAFTNRQRELIGRANRELGREGDFVPVVVEALWTLEDGRVIAQIAADETGSELDVFAEDGRLLGTVRTPLRLHPESEPASRGDTLLLPVVGELDVPIIVKAVLEGAQG